jgi:chaperonin GroES
MKMPTASGPRDHQAPEGRRENQGRFIIPDTAKEKPIEGTRRRRRQRQGARGRHSPSRLDVKEGDRVLFGKYSGTEVKIDGEEHLILREDDILGVLEA